MFNKLLFKSWAIVPERKITEIRKIEGISFFMVVKIIYEF
jgi:hypothetical protein